MMAANDVRKNIDDAMLLRVLQEFDRRETAFLQPDHG